MSRAAGVSGPPERGEDLIRVIRAIRGLSISCDSKTRPTNYDPLARRSEHNQIAVTVDDRAMRCATWQRGTELAEVKKVITMTPHSHEKQSFDV